MNATQLIRFAGILYLGIIAAGASMPRVVRLREHLHGLPDFIRSLFWVYYGFIGFCLISFASVSLFLAPELASGTPLARAVCGFLALFWLIRLAVATFVFDVRPYLTRLPLKIGYQATNLVFVLLPILYGYAALKGGPA